MDKDKMLVRCDIKKVSRKFGYTVGSMRNFTHPSVAYIKSGRAEFLCCGKTIRAQSGDLVYIAMHTRYYSMWYGSPDIEFYVVDFAFAASYLFYDYRFQVIRGFSKDGFEKMYQARQSSPFAAMSEFYKILDRVYGTMTPEKNLKKYINIEPAIGYTEENFTKPIKIGTLAALCNCSESALFKAFNSVMEMSPITYKHNIMVQHALDLLTNTNLSIEEVSRRTGFASANYFRKVFFKITGKTPTQARKKQFGENTY